MKKIISGGTGEFTDKKSRFIANIYHIEDENNRTAQKEILGCTT